VKRLSRVGLGVLAATALTTATLAVGSPAQAHPVITNVNCESGGGQFLCDLAVAGSFGPLQIRWVINNQARPALNDQTSIQGTCTIGRHYSVRVTVTDIVGSDTASYSFPCRRIWQ
jgi:hypothetical protein